MDLPRPKTYNELMLYKRCLEFKSAATDMDNALLAEIYNFMLEDRNHRVVAESGEVSFENSEGSVRTAPMSLRGSYVRVTLTSAAIHMMFPPTNRGSGGYSSGGSGGNNNNNNNNNNA